MTKGTLGAILLATLSLTACILPPHDAPKQVAATAETAGLSTISAPVINDVWWHTYGDPQFGALVDHALAGNPTLAQALARLQGAAAAAQAADSARYPQANFDTQEVRQRFSGNDIIPPPFGRNVYWRGDIATNLTWDLDFWGEQAALVGQARDRALADQLDLAAARLALTTAMAQAYSDLDHAYLLGDIARRTITQRQAILDITQHLVEGGIDTRVELQQAGGELAQSRVDLERAEDMRALATHQLAELAGLGASAYQGITRPTLSPNTALPLPQALPADLLARRPDILAARMRINAADSGRKAAKAAFYPDVSLTAFTGFSAIGFDDLFRYASFNYGLGPVIHLPLFDAGRLKAQYRGATADLDAAIAAYNDTVLRAVQETADALTNVQSLRRQRQDQRIALDDSQTAYDLAVQRYRAGLTGYLTVLSAQTDLLAAQRSLADIDTAEISNRIRLLAAIGGSFTPARDLPPLATSPILVSSETLP